MACQDEAAGDDELLSHVLWYHPETDEIAARHERLSLVEGLIAFGAAVSDGCKVESVLMERSRYCMVECEPGVWMVWCVAVGDDSPSELALKSQMLQVYDGFALLHKGGVLSLLEGEREAISRFASKRRALRKARNASEKDYEGDEYCTRHAEEARSLGAELAKVTDPAAACRAALSSHMKKRVDARKSSVDLSVDVCGLEQAPPNATVLARAQRLERDLCALDERVRGCALLHHGALVWSGLPPRELALLHRYTSTTRDQAGPRRRHGFAAPNLGTVRLAAGDNPASRCLDEHQEVAGNTTIWCPSVCFARREVSGGGGPCAWRSLTRGGGTTPPRREEEEEECALFYTSDDWSLTILLGDDENLETDFPPLCLLIQSTVDASLKALSLVVPSLSQNKMNPSTRNKNNTGASFAFADARAYALSSSQSQPEVLRSFEASAIRTLEDLAARMEDDPEPRETFLRLDTQRGWLVAKSQQDRRLFVRLDARHGSVPELDETLNDLYLTGPLKSRLMLPP